MPLEDYEWLPCWGCIADGASDVRLWILNASDEDRENQRSPSGLPLCCCRIRTVGVIPKPDATHAAR
jgi:hypothetical protein